MEDLPDALRRHYDEQRLRDDRAHSILAAGRGQAAQYRHRLQRRWLTAAAAMLAVGLGIAGSWTMHSRRTSSHSAQITVSDVSQAVVQFFGSSRPALGQLSPHLADLQTWLAGKGAPASFVVPQTLKALESLGCQVLDIRGQHISLLCFYLEPAVPEPADESSGLKGAPVPQPAASRSLVHLLVAPRTAFADAPRIGERVRLDPQGDWKFVAWSKGDWVFLAASDARGSPFSAVVDAL